MPFEENAEAGRPGTALVLGGGGPVGASWTSALLTGLAAAGIPLADCDVLGTSAGAVVGAWLTIDPDGLPNVPALMRDRAAWHARNASAGLQDTATFEAVLTDSAPGTGRPAMAPISVDQAGDLWRDLLPAGPWPARLRMVSVGATTGAARVWSAGDHLPLAAGVACSTAAPGIAPPVRVDGETWLDGGVRTGTNADLVDASVTRVLVVAPLPSADLATEAALLTGRGCRVRTVVAQRFYAKPTDLIDARFVDVGAAAGAEQARDLAPELAAWWSA
ncbi:patatin-like phospholipase family protein [Lentzea sp. JNUCC 0626]|uniref:patatin-like phospholipase family protein n=1 Tax=Lentzea sp. JNUCC 0626 TaxID=3367513 RepID=UPI00374A79DD